MEIKSYLNAALKLAISLIIVNAILDFIDSYTGGKASNIVYSPLKTLGVVK